MQRRGTCVVFQLLAFTLAHLITTSTPPPLQFSPSLTQTSVRETFVAGGSARPAEGFVAVRCIDSTGVPTSGDVTYSIVDSDPGPFLLNATTGRLSVTDDLDYEMMTSYSFAVACVNISDPNITGMGMVQIGILPVNEFEPVIMPRSFRTIKLSEDTPVGTTIASTEPGGILQYSVTDQDMGPDGNITFTLSENSPDNIANARFFDLNLFTGALVLSQKLDVDNVPNAFDRVSLRITACDVYPPNEDCPNLLVNMILFSANDNSPRFSSDTYEVLYPESIPVGTPVVTAVCTDSDRGTGEFAGIEIYQPTSELWQLPNTTNGTVVLNMSLDYETAQMHEFILRCYDTNEMEDFATVTVTVLPVNDNKPQFNQSEYVFVMSRITSPLDGSEIGRVQAIDHDLGNGRTIAYSMEENDNFAIDANEGIILLKDYVLSTEGSYFNMTVAAFDGNFRDTAQVIIKVSGPLSIADIVVIGLGGLILVLLFTCTCCLCKYRRACCRRPPNPRNRRENRHEVKPQHQTMGVPSPLHRNASLHTSRSCQQLEAHTTNSQLEAHITNSQPEAHTTNSQPEAHTTNSQPEAYTTNSQLEPHTTNPPILYERLDKILINN